MRQHSIKETEYTFPSRMQWHEKCSRINVFQKEYKNKKMLSTSSGKIPISSS